MQIILHGHGLGGLSLQKCNLVPTVKHISQELGEELCKIFKELQ